MVTSTFFVLFLTIALVIGLLVGILTMHFLGRKKMAPVWPNRGSVEPSTTRRFNAARNSIFLVGLSFEGTFNSHKEYLVKTLNRGVKVRILLLHPDAKHLEAHQEFADRALRIKIEENINLRLRNLFVEELTAKGQKGISVVATHYLPRFSVAIWDNSIMYLNFYLYKSSASSNPVLVLKRTEQKEAFQHIETSLERLFSDPDNTVIVENGNWKGL